MASAVQLYQNLIRAILKIYEKDGDVPISAATPSDAASPPGVFPDGSNRSRATSPATIASSSVATPPERSAPFGYINQQSQRRVEQPMHAQYSNEAAMSSPPIAGPSSSAYPPTGSGNVPTMQSFQNEPYTQQQQLPQYFDPYTQFNPLPEFTPDLTVPGWTAATEQRPQFAAAGPANLSNQYNYASHPVFDPANPAYPFPGTFDPNMPGGDAFMPQQGDLWDMDAGVFGTGLNQMQQEELMHNLETDGMEDIQSMISATVAAITPKAPQNPTF